MRQQQLENLVMTGKLDGKKGPERPRTSFLTILKKWLGPTANENIILQASAKREMARRDRQRLAHDDDDKEDECRRLI